MWSRKKQQPPCDIESQNCISTDIKYGHADLASKKRKSTEDAIETTGEEADELNYEEFKSETCLNSSFKQSPPESEVEAKNEIDTQQDFKGGLLLGNENTCINNKSNNSTFSTSANSSLILITDKPSQCSKGLENSFKILQNQVETNKQKSLNALSSLSLTSNSLNNITINETASRFELELEAAARAQRKTKHDKKDLLTFLNDFSLVTALKQQQQHKLNDIQEVEEIEDEKSTFMYHVAKSTDGSNCLKKVRNAGESIGIYVLLISLMSQRHKLSLSLSLLLLLIS